MGCVDFRPQLSDYVDGTLDEAARAAVAGHLVRCAACADVVHDFVQLRSAARELGPIEPPGHVWLELAGRLHQDASGKRSIPAAPAGSSQVWQWVGLAAALVLITLGAYVLRHVSSNGSTTNVPTVATVGNPAAAGSVETFEQELKQAEDHYDRAIAELEAIAKNNNTSMDPAVAATLQKNLTTIDHAIAESRDALNVNPASEPARDSLFEALRQKVGVLQATVTLMNEMRKGNQDGAARAVAGLGRKSS
jgi:Putative zinc-finger